MEIFSLREDSEKENSYNDNNSINSYNACDKNNIDNIDNLINKNIYVKKKKANNNNKLNNKKLFNNINISSNKSNKIDNYYNHLEHSNISDEINKEIEIIERKSNSRFIDNNLNNSGSVSSCNNNNIKNTYKNLKNYNINLKNNISKNKIINKNKQKNLNNTIQCNNNINLSSNPILSKSDLFNYNTHSNYKLYNNNNNNNNNLSYKSFNRLNTMSRNNNFKTKQDYLARINNNSNKYKHCYNSIKSPVLQDYINSIEYKNEEFNNKIQEIIRMKQLIHTQNEEINNLNADILLYQKDNKVLIEKIEDSNKSIDYLSNYVNELQLNLSNEKDLVVSIDKKYSLLELEYSNLELKVKYYKDKEEKFLSQNTFDNNNNNYKTNSVNVSKILKIEEDYNLMKEELIKMYNEKETNYINKINILENEIKDIKTQYELKCNNIKTIQNNNNLTNNTSNLIDEIKGLRNKLSSEQKLKNKNNEEYIKFSYDYNKKEKSLLKQIDDINRNNTEEKRLLNNNINELKNENQNLKSKLNNFELLLENINKDNNEITQEYIDNNKHINLKYNNLKSIIENISNNFNASIKILKSKNFVICNNKHNIYNSYNMFKFNSSDIQIDEIELSDNIKFIFKGIDIFVYFVKEYINLIDEKDKYLNEYKIALSQVNSIKEKYNNLFTMYKKDINIKNEEIALIKYNNKKVVNNIQKSYSVLKI